MRGVLKIALRNILRSRRRSAMTASLIVIGMLLVMCSRECSIPSST